MVQNFFNSPLFLYDASRCARCAWHDEVGNSVAASQIVNDDFGSVADGLVTVDDFDKEAFIGPADGSV